MNEIFKKVRLIEDNVTDLEILKNIIDERGNDDPLHILDLGDVLKKHRIWMQKMPRVTPYYAVKCNPNEIVIKLLAMLGINFDCASKGEIMQVMGLGVSSDRIIFANTVKYPTHIEYAKKVGVHMMTVDHEEELKKIKEIFPKARVMIRIQCGAKNSRFDKKFGCEPTTESVNLIKSTMQLGLHLFGFSFHTGTPCYELDAICRGIRTCNNLIHVARSLGCYTANVLNIGGGMPGVRGFDIDEFAGPINAELDKIDRSIKIMAEPGSYYVTSAGTLAARIIGKKVKSSGEDRTFSYHVTDGVHGSIFMKLMVNLVRLPVVCDITRNNNVDEKKYISTIWGPTCNPYDCILDEELLPEYHMGDWLAWYDVGSYASCLAQKFNGFQPPTVYPVMRRSDWASMWNINNQEASRRTTSD